jgi:DNA-binding CsgD family transcriptional regulator
MTDEDRQAVERARYLNRTTDLRRRVCETIAYAERGYSSAGIAKKIDATEGTVSNYLDRAVAHLGPEAVFPRAEADRGDLNAVARGEVAEWPAHYRDMFVEAAADHPDVAPSGARRVAEGSL